MNCQTAYELLDLAINPNSNPQHDYSTTLLHLKNNISSMPVHHPGERNGDRRIHNFEGLMKKSEEGTNAFKAEKTSKGCENPVQNIQLTLLKRMYFMASLSAGLEYSICSFCFFLICV